MLGSDATGIVLLANAPARIIKRATVRVVFPFAKAKSTI
jgi:hypothetical protein